MLRDTTRIAARAVLIVATTAIAIGYASAFARGGAPAWAPWLLAIGIPAALGAIMALGAARGARGLGSLKLPFAFVFVVLAMGFCLALAIPVTAGKHEAILLGLPLRAAIIVYGIGLLPIVVLPVAYAITFDTQTLNEDDVARVRELAAKTRAQRDTEAAR
ncbi:MAG TPA: hypothetical protein VFD22_08625 [Gemmatimonadaceae bacterium]|nr:hypothetical protein [Gemmatimonadaceae bacterium]